MSSACGMLEDLAIPPTPSSTHGGLRTWDRSSRALSGAEPRNSSILRVVNDSDGRVWVNGVHAPASWRLSAPDPSSGVTAGPDGSISGTAAALEEWVAEQEMWTTETVIDVFDLSGRALVATARFPGMLWLLTSRVAYRLESDPSGLPTISLMRVELRR